MTLTHLVAVMENTSINAGDPKLPVAGDPCLWRTDVDEYRLWQKGVVVEVMDLFVRIKYWSPFSMNPNGDSWFERVLPLDHVVVL